ncbi:16S rRNA (cytidine(1402)-2'-O)-methyltransferase [Vineibacter terrae]|uniref:16S rRNA (cytidine(1402)-2'-O)-methyltransferase n=1 Tax=Vineibacter terrae TaxID=2586908 RepID=UPI0039C922CA
MALPTRTLPAREDGSDRAGASKPAPGLYLVATPIGNARDITLRALDILHAADIIACEDTRVTRTLLTLYGISATVIACHDHNEATAADRILAEVAAGKVVAMVSDAGMPLVSDPGHRVVRAAIDAGRPVTVVPGPSAPLAALALAGLPNERFLFAGFLPAKPSARRETIASLASVPATLMFFEAPHRLVETLADLADLLGARPAAVARELTKRFEEVRRAPLDALARHYAEAGPPKGEIVLVIAPPGPQAGPAAGDIEAALRTALAQTGVREAAAEVAARFGLPRREVYAQALALKRSSP